MFLMIVSLICLSFSTSSLCMDYFADFYLKEQTTFFQSEKTYELQKLCSREESSTMPTDKKEALYALYYQANNLIHLPNPTYPKLTKLIDDYKNAEKKYNLTEDQIGRFAFTEDRINDLELPPVHQRTSLFFYFLKKYNQTVFLNNEPLLSNRPVLLQQILHLETPQIPTPAMDLFIQGINQLRNNNVPYYHHLALFIHSNPKLTTIPAKKLLKKEWKDDFIHKSVELFQHMPKTDSSENYNEKIDKNLHKIIFLLNKAKFSKTIKSEEEMGHYALDYQSSFFTFLSFKLSESYNDYKEKVALLCSLIWQYNKSIGKKIIPSFVLSTLYDTILDLPIAFPDTFDTKLFDPTRVAYEEYYDLREHIKILHNTDKKDIQECVEKIYKNNYKKIS